MDREIEEIEKRWDTPDSCRLTWNNAKDDIKHLLSHISTLEEKAGRLQEEVQKWQRIRTPTHGPCCTCQRCGQHYDDCRCDLDEIVDQLQQAESRLKETESERERLSKLLIEERMKVVELKGAIEKVIPILSNNLMDDMVEELYKILKD